MRGQLVRHVGKRAAGGLVPSEYKDERLRQDLCVGQGCGEMSKTHVG